MEKKTETTFFVCPLGLASLFQTYMLRSQHAKVGGVPAEQFSGPQVFNFSLGSGDMCDALDFAAATMRIGEEAGSVWNWNCARNACPLGRWL